MAVTPVIEHHVGNLNTVSIIEYLGLYRYLSLYAMIVVLYFGMSPLSPTRHKTRK